MSLKRTRGAVYDLTYHVVWVPKYRRMVLGERVAYRLKMIFQEIAERYGTDLKSISRYVAYYEQDGSLEARTQYRALSMRERDASRIDLHALRQRCDYHVDYADIVQRAERYFA